MTEPVEKKKRITKKRVAFAIAVLLVGATAYVVRANRAAFPISRS